MRDRETERDRKKTEADRGGEKQTDRLTDRETDRKRAGDRGRRNENSHTKLDIAHKKLFRSAAMRDQSVFSLQHLTL